MGTWSLEFSFRNMFWKFCILALLATTVEEVKGGSARHRKRTRKLELKFKDIEAYAAVIEARLQALEQGNYLARESLQQDVTQDENDLRSIESEVDNLGSELDVAEYDIDNLGSELDVAEYDIGTIEETPNLK